MYYYLSDGIYFAQDSAISNPVFQEISKDEYDAGIARLKELATKEEETIAAAEQSKDEKIAELEQENAALLYQLLTGEEYTDV